MMRTIKFRAWNKEEEKYEEHSDEVMLDGEGSLLWRSYYDEYGELNSDDFVIEQFTGLTDKNGKEIYEGDILAFDKDFDDTDNTFIVFFDEKISAFNFRIYGYKDYISESGSLEYEGSKSVIGEMENLEREDILFYLEYVSVIGNIHENETAKIEELCGYEVEE